MRTFVVALSFLAASCVYEPPLSETYYLDGSDRAIVATVVEEWESVGLAAWTCDAWLDDARIVIASDATFADLCLACPPDRCEGGRVPLSCTTGCAGSCYRRTPLAQGDIRRAVLVVHESSDERLAIAHEAVHMVAHCALGHPDAAHRDASAWGEHGDCSGDSVCGRAMARAK